MRWVALADASVSPEAESLQHPVDQFRRRTGSIKRLAESIAHGAGQHLVFVREGTQLELALVEGADLGTPLDPPQVVLARQGESEATQISIQVGQPAPQVHELGVRPPEVIDHEVAVPEALVVADQKLDRRMQVFPLVGAGRIGCDEVIPVEHDTLVDVLGQRFRER